MEKVDTKELKLVHTPIFPYQEVVQTKIFSVSDRPVSLQKESHFILRLDENKLKSVTTQK